ncbi:MAG: hypothetical protein QM800_08335 [Paludibacter sp.]
MLKLIEMNSDSHVFAGTCGGMLLTIFSNMFIEDLARTVILAIVGALVSFGVSLALKRMIKNPRPLKGSKRK